MKRAQNAFFGTIFGKRGRLLAKVWLWLSIYYSNWTQSTRERESFGMFFASSQITSLSSLSCQLLSPAPDLVPVSQVIQARLCFLEAVFLQLRFKEAHGSLEEEAHLVII